MVAGTAGEETATFVAGCDKSRRFFPSGIPARRKWSAAGMSKYLDVATVSTVNYFGSDI